MTLTEMCILWSRARFIINVSARFAVLSHCSRFGEKLKNSDGEKYLNIYSPFRYLLFEFTGAHRIICPLFAAWLWALKNVLYDTRHTSKGAGV